MPAIRPLTITPCDTLVSHLLLVPSLPCSSTPLPRQRIIPAEPAACSPPAEAVKHPVKVTASSWVLLVPLPSAAPAAMPQISCCCSCKAQCYEDGCNQAPDASRGQALLLLIAGWRRRSLAAVCSSTIVSRADESRATQGTHELSSPAAADWILAGWRRRWLAAICSRAGHAADIRSRGCFSSRAWLSSRAVAEAGNVGGEASALKGMRRWAWKCSETTHNTKAGDHGPVGPVYGCSKQLMQGAHTVLAEQASSAASRAAAAESYLPSHGTRRL